MNVDEIKLHLGCGKRKLPGWFGIDSRPESAADYIGDVRDLGHWASGDVAAIYACHVLEHIPRPEVLATLREWRRVLVPGGVLRVSVPDFAVLADLYVNHGVAMWRLIGPLYGRQDYPENTHYAFYDYEYLAWLLAVSEFHTIDEWSSWDWQPDGYDDYSRAKINGIPISLNVEAIRGA